MKEYEPSGPIHDLHKSPQQRFGELELTTDHQHCGVGDAVGGIVTLERPFREGLSGGIGEREA